MAGGRWTDEDAQRLAAALGPRVRERAAVLFGLLAEQGEVDSAELALALGLGDPRRLAGAVNTHLKVACRRLGLPLPFDGGSSHAARGGPTTWQDRDGNAARLTSALRR